MRSQPRCTKNVSDFDETFSVCREFNSKHFGKKSFSNSPYCREALAQILEALKVQKSDFFQKFTFFVVQLISLKQCPK
jgi:hypothetical protein